MSGPKLSEFTVKADLSELFKKIVARECGLRESLGFMQCMLCEMEEEQADPDTSEFKLAELTSLRETVSTRFVEYSGIIEKALAKTTDMAGIGKAVDALVEQNKLEEASNMIRQANSEMLVSLSKQEKEISEFIGKSKNELTGIIEKYTTASVESISAAPPKRDKHTRIEESRERKQRITHEHILKLTVRYNALCAAKKREPFALQGFPVTEEYAKEMEARIQRMQDEMVRDREQAYIQKTVERLISGMGHEIVGHRDYPDSGNPELFKSELYRCGGSSAIKASYSSNGAVLMEIVGLSDTEREPTGAETAMLCNEMESFCQEFSELRQNLKYLGIYQSMVYERSVEEKHARIESIRDYTLQDGVSTESLLMESDTRKSAATPEKMYLTLASD